MVPLFLSAAARRVLSWPCDTAWSRITAAMLRAAQKQGPLFGPFPSSTRFKKLEFLELKGQI